MNNDNGGDAASVLATVLRDLDLVDERLRATVNESGAMAVTVAGHLIAAGGKRLRPMLTMASTRAVHGQHPETPIDPRSVAAAVAVELLHVGSLYHDDVIDEAPTRRSKPSANAKWGNLRAVLGGDLLLALSAIMAAELGQLESQILSRTLLSLCEGQLLESRDTFDLGRTREAYFQAILGKTASLFCSSCLLGGLQTDASDTELSALADFGRQLGKAFQIVDDVLDLLGDPKKLGKEVGSDIRQGVYTLPLLLYMDRGLVLADEIRREIEELAIEQVVRRLRESGDVNRALSYADALADAAREIAATVKQPTLLHAMVDLVMEPVADFPRNGGDVDADDLAAALSFGDAHDSW